MAMSRSPDISIIVPVIDGETRVAACLAALWGTRAALEVVLVDNGSTDATVAAATAVWPDLVVVSNPENRGFAPACNQGAAAATGRYLLFLNDDAIVSSNTLDELLAVAEVDLTCAVWQPPLLDDTSTRWDSAGSMFTRAGLLWHHPAGQTVASNPRPAMRVFAAKGACMLVRTDDFTAVGGFDDSFFAYFEETDLCWRLALLGRQCRLADAAPVRHVGGVTARRIFSPGELDFMFFRNRLISLLTLPSARTLTMILPLHLTAVFGLLVAALATGQRERARGIGRAITWVPRHRRELTARRRHWQSVRTVDDAAVFDGLWAAPTLRELASAGLGYLGKTGTADDPADDGPVPSASAFKMMLKARRPRRARWPGRLPLR